VLCARACMRHSMRRFNVGAVLVCGVVGVSGLGDSRRGSDLQACKCARHTLWAQPDGWLWAARQCRLHGMGAALMQSLTQNQQVCRWHEWPRQGVTGCAACCCAVLCATTQLAASVCLGTQTTSRSIQIHAAGMQGGIPDPHSDSAAGNVWHGALPGACTERHLQVAVAMASELQRCCMHGIMLGVVYLSGWRCSLPRLWTGSTAVCGVGAALETSTLCATKNRATSTSSW
jgi:hypothetical protein